MSSNDINIAEEQARIKVLADELDRLCKKVAYSIDRSELANANDVTYQAIGRMLNTNSSQEAWKLYYVPSLAVKAPDRFRELVLTFLANLSGGEVTRKKTLTPEQENIILKQQIKLMHLDLHPNFKDLM